MSAVVKTEQANYEKAIREIDYSVGAKGHIGGSRAAAVMGVNPFNTPVDAYLAIIGESTVDLSRNQPVYWGLALEDVLATEYAKREDCKVRRNNQTLIHPKYPWMCAHIDRERVGTKRVVEIKTGSAYVAYKWGEPGTDAVPDEYMIQVQHYMNVGKYDSADIGVLLGGQQFSIYHIPRNEDLIRIIEEALVEFWDKHVIPKSPPEAVNDSDLQLLYAKDDGKEIIAEDYVADTMMEITSLDAKLKGYGIERDLKAIIVKRFMRENSVLIDTVGKPLATWKAPKPSKIFNMELFKEENSKLHKTYVEPRDNSRRFLVKK